MKKTLFLLLALSSTCWANGNTTLTNQTIIYGLDTATNPWGFGTYISYAGTNGYTENISSAGDIEGIGYTLQKNTGKMWAKPYSADAVWNNTSALDEYNEATGQQLTTEQLLGATFTSSNAGGARTSLQLTFDKNKYSDGDIITMYAFVAGFESQLTQFNVTGLEEGTSTIEIASGIGNGFGDASVLTNWADTQCPNIVKITGFLEADEDGNINNVVLQGNSTKSGFAAVTTIVTLPQPDNYYWENGNGSWSEEKWSTTDNETSSLMSLPTSGTVNVFFNNNETATIAIGSGVSVTSMRVESGTYTYTGDSGSKIELESLSVSKSGKATFGMNIETGTVTVEGADSSLIGQDITIGTSFTMTSGTLEANQINGTGKVSITGGKVELTNGSIASGGTTITGATLAGTTSLTRVTLGSVTIDATKVDITSSVLHSGITLTNGQLAFAGNMELSADYSIEQVLVYSEDGTELGTANGNGYAVTHNQYTVITGNGETVTNNANWTINGKDLTWNDGVLHGESSVNTDTYWINSGTVNYDTNMALMSRTNDTLFVNLHGGNLDIAGEYVSPALITTDTEGAKVILGANGVLHSSSIDNNSAKTIALSGSGQYHTDGSAELHATNRVTFATDWTGAVHTGDLSAPVALDITGLSQAGASVVMNHVSAQRITGGAAKQVSAKSLTLGSGSSFLGADNVTLEALSLGTGAGAATLETTGSLTVKGDITLGHEKSSVTAASLTDTDALNFAMSTQVLNKTYGSTVLLTLTDATANGQGVNVVLNNGAAAANGKFTHTLGWSADYRQVVLNSVFNQQYFNSNTTTPNGQAGAKLLTDIFETGNLQFNSDSQISKAIDGLDALIAAGDKVGADKLMAAVAGASTAAQGMALAGDVERQLRAIRNRTTTVGVNQCVVNEDMPYVNAWVNAEGNLGELDEDGTFAGYSLESWGGTIGFDVDVNPSFTLGLAVTAMYGNLSVSGPDMLEGDMDTVYLSAFARYASRAWTHTFIGTVGSMSGSYERTVSWDNGNYRTKGDPDGSAFGLMYELGRVMAIDDDGDACWQPVLNVAYRHASVGGYSETGSDAALKVGDQTLDTVTFGAGARLQAVVGENFYNRTSLLELRALAKLDAGDRSSEADVAFIGAGRKACVESAELGAFGVELGAGLHVPMGDEDSGTLFFDVSAELRSGYSNVNGTVGYRINF